MGPCVDSAVDVGPIIMKPPTCFEIIGLPGSGKTTLALKLRDRHQQFHLKLPPNWKQLRTFPFYLKNSLSLAPVWTSLTFSCRGRRLSIEEYLSMIFLNGWHRQLTRRDSDRGVIVLDQGPVFMLSQMILYRERQMANSLFRQWWKKTVGNWRCVLDRLIWLDSSDSVLAHRINTRGQDHIIKGASFSQIRDFLKRRRMVLDKAVTMLRGDHRTPDVMCFDTGQQSLDDIVDALLGEFGLNKK